MTALSTRRAGGALLLVLLFMFVIDALVLGTLHMAMLERRLAENATAALRLQLAARSAAATALVPWQARFDSIAANSAGVSANGHSADGLQLTTHVEALVGGILMVRAEAREMPPRFGAAHAATLWLPPALPANHHAAAAALAAHAIHLENGGTVIASAGDSCTAGAAVRATVLPLGGSGTVQGTVDMMPAETSLAPLTPALLARASAAAAPRLLTLHGDTTITQDFGGVLIAGGTLVIARDVVVRGLVITGESLTVEAGSAIIGAAHVGGAARVAGSLHLDACRVNAELEATGLTRPLPLPQRHVLPGL